jgi:CheY-like chemotaxis protein
LLDISRIARGKIELKRERCEIADVIAKSIEMASPLLEARRHHLDVAVSRAGLEVFGDSVRLAQVVANLLMNAAKYTEPGGHISMSAEKDGDEIVIQVSDDGIGIPPEMLPCIFDQFVQGPRALDRAEGGLGLGLAIARGLVVQHGGNVSAHSDGVGHGAVFTVRLPAFQEDPSHSMIPKASESSAVLLNSRHYRVLVVDDNEDAADMLAVAVQIAGYETAVAHDGPEALAVAATFRPDVALLDIGLPVMDGYELAARLRELLPTKPLHLIAVTGYGQEDHRERSRAAGFDMHFVKPIDVASLLLVLNEILPTEMSARDATA